MKDAQFNKLEKIFGKTSFIVKDIPERFSYDESTVYKAVPEAVFLPSNEEEVIAFLKIANEEHISIVPRGLGTGVCGGAVAVYGGVVLSMEKMNKIKELDEENMCVIAEPGVNTGFLKSFLEERGYYYPPDPQSYETSSIGGNVATNAGGPRAVRYGTTKDYVMSLDIYASTGDMLTTKGMTYKFSSGYNLNEIFCGSEGTLGVIGSVTLKILPLPSANQVFLIPFKSIEYACKFLKEAISKRFVFSAFEFIDDTSKYYVEQFLLQKLPYSDVANCYVFAEMEQCEDNTILDSFLELVMKSGGLDVYAAKDKGQEERLWEARRKISEAFKFFAKYIYKADIVVPRANIAQLVKEAKQISFENLQLACFGHVGDGNVHLNILDINGSYKDFAEKIMGLVMEKVKMLGGFPSGEHGIGVAKKNYLKNFFSQYHLEIFKKLKKVFDPSGIMNPGKIF